jgi:hypothetical protein
MSDQPQDLRDKVRLAELANIAKKLKLGKTLNAREASLIDDESSQRKVHISFDAMSSASKILEIPIAEIKRAKLGGCSGFRNGRIYRVDLLEWLEENPAATGATPTINEVVSDAEMESRKLAAITLKAELELDRARGKVIDRDLVASEWATHITQLFTILDKSLDAPLYTAICKEMKHYLSKSFGVTANPADAEVTPPEKPHWRKVKAEKERVRITTAKAAMK